MKEKETSGKMKRNSRVSATKNLIVTNSGTLRSLIRRNNEGNLQQLEQLGILDKFVQENNGSWDHQKWMELCGLIEKQDLGPIDFDKVGLILEEKKAKHSFPHQMNFAQTEYANPTV
ncbi:MAG: hypothetical protein NT118_15920 [Lentisphaerae bacterium]|nr:hypothetical protein [Lentisphaerota bacterium]